MSSNLVEKIAEKAATLPPEGQRAALSYIESLAANSSVGNAPPRAYRSVEGILPAPNLDNLESDLAEVRQEMWRNFPREEP